MPSKPIKRERFVGRPRKPPPGRLPRNPHIDERSDLALRAADGDYPAKLLLTSIDLLTAIEARHQRSPNGAEREVVSRLVPLMLESERLERNLALGRRVTPYALQALQRTLNTITKTLELLGVVGYVPASQNQSFSLTQVNSQTTNNTNQSYIASYTKDQVAAFDAEREQLRASRERSANAIDGRVEAKDRPGYVIDPQVRAGARAFYAQTPKQELKYEERKPIQRIYLTQADLDNAKEFDDDLFTEDEPPAFPSSYNPRNLVQAAREYTAAIDEIEGEDV